MWHDGKEKGEVCLFLANTYGPCANLVGALVIGIFLKVTLRLISGRKR